MEKRTKIIIGVVVAILVILVAGFLFLSNANVTLQGNEAAVTLPGNYTLDDKGIATAGNTSVMFTGIMSGSGGSEANFYKAVSQNGKEAGYKNISKSDINGYKVYEFAAYPDKLKNVSTDEVATDDGGTSWWTFEPYFPWGSEKGIDHYRMLTYVKDGNVNYLSFFTKDPNTSLYTSEIDNIINSIGPIEQ